MPGLEPGIGHVDGRVVGAVDAVGGIVGKRPRGGLAKGDTVEELLLVEPLTTFHEVALHVADEGHGATEPEAPEVQEPERVRRRPVRDRVQGVIFAYESGLTQPGSATQG